MSSFDMPARRTYAPEPKAVAKFVIRAIVFSLLAVLMVIAAKFLWSYAFRPSEAATTRPAEVQAATPPPSPRGKVAVGGTAPVDTRPKTDVVEEAAALQERLAVSICEGYGLIFDGPDKGCVRPPPPKAWSGEGIRERAAPVAAAVQAVQRMVDERTRSEEWRPSLRLQGFLHEPGEPCRGGGHRDEMGLFCKFTDEERAELRERRRW